MKKVLILFLLSIIFFIMDNVLMPFFSIKTIYPSLLLTFMVCYSVANGKWEGLWLGVFGGMLQDIYFINGFGLNALTNMIICIIAGVIGDNIFKEKSLIPVASCFALSVFKGVLLILILYLCGIHSSLSDIFFTGIYNMIIGVIMYKKVYRFCQKDYMQIRWKF
ncbi:rod shape-determining protein MreD [Clostridiaceae bacterium UIB06]|uniref:Rod shape-determining protein MreD n=1 Tax=Clostridium thailandense TaxID=2794346 RepID=A0A949TYW3_9CLOT|nr:rod shape-determining protein MreD [Clostridium thailandense]MBV7273074.1 rod shape-determining protein MreD [Clostridium thailandense]MCH5135738.1 rod shape-determining protein MreD [Clostridiaceae bacterium UIB06]